MDFWQSFLLLLIYIPLLLVWGTSIVDIFRRDDMGGVGKAAWLVVVILLPLVGTLIYLIVRRPGATAQEREIMDLANREFVATYSPDASTQQLLVLADLHDRGKLTDAEFDAEKSRILAAEPAGPPSAPAPMQTRRRATASSPAAGSRSTAGKQ
jgi:hypothetical protein